MNSCESMNPKHTPLSAFGGFIWKSHKIGNRLTAHQSPTNRLYRAQGFFSLWCISVSFRVLCYWLPPVFSPSRRPVSVTATRRSELGRPPISSRLRRNGKPFVAILQHCWMSFRRRRMSSILRLNSSKIWPR